METVERWALSRGVRCVDWNVMRGSKISYDDKAVGKCEVNQLLKDPDLVIEWCKGNVNLSEKLCKDITRANKIKKGVDLGFTRISQIKRIDRRFPELN